MCAKKRTLSMFILSWDCNLNSIIENIIVDKAERIN